MIPCAAYFDFVDQYIYHRLGQFIKRHILTNDLMLGACGANDFFQTGNLFLGTLTFFYELLLVLTELLRYALKPFFGNITLDFVNLHYYIICLKNGAFTISLNDKKSPADVICPQGIHEKLLYAPLCFFKGFCPTTLGSTWVYYTIEKREIYKLLF